MPAAVIEASIVEQAIQHPSQKAVWERTSRLVPPCYQFGVPLVMLVQLLFVGVKADTFAVEGFAVGAHCCVQSCEMYVEPVILSCALLQLQITKQVRAHLILVSKLNN